MRWIGRIALGLLCVPAVLAVLWLFLPPVSTLMLKNLVLQGGYDRQFVPISVMPDVVAASVIASEDARFCVHHGVDWGELKAVVKEAMDEGEASRGASTLAMQVARNLFLWQGAPGTIRKGLEVPLALFLDLVWSKRQMMEVYLNIAEWGPDGRFGIDAGARHAFGKPALRLTAQEAAMLVAILPNPRQRSAAKPTGGVSRKAQLVARRAAQVDVSCLARR